jgi:hypothetical protein
VPYAYGSRYDRQSRRAIDSGSRGLPLLQLGGFPVNYYTTTFPLTENPISENGVWINAGVVGQATDVRTTTNKAFGTETGNNGFDDSVAILRGTFGSDQMAQGSVFTTNNNAGDWAAEVEVQLRFNLSPLTATGYEFNYSVKGASRARTARSFASTRPIPVGSLTSRR